MLFECYCGKESPLTIRRFPTTHRRLAAPCLAVGLAFVLLVLFCVGAQAGPAPTSAYASPTLVPASGPVITIGLAAPLSGGLGWLGQPQLNGVQLAISETNAAGGVQIGGVTYTLHLATGDDAKCSGESAPGAAAQLLADGAVAVVGHTCSGASLAADDIYNAAGVAMVSPSSTNPDVTEQGFTTTFRVTSRDDAPAARLAEYCREVLAMDRAAIITTGGHPAVIGAFSSTFATLGGQITGLWEVDWADFIGTMVAVASTQPDVVFFCEAANPGDAALLRYGATSGGLEGVPIAWSTSTDDEGVLSSYISGAAGWGVSIEGDLAGMNPRRAQDMPGFSSFRLRYQAAYGEQPQGLAAFAYDTAGIIVDAMGRAESADPAAIRDAIAGMHDYQGVVGPCEGFDEKGDVIPQWPWLVRFTGGGWIQLHPGKSFLPLALHS